MDMVELEKQLNNLYDKFIHGRLEHHTTSYFHQLQLFYEKGTLKIKRMALELVLLILRGDFTQRTKGLEILDVGELGIVQLRLQQIRQEMNDDSNSDSRSGEHSEDQNQNEKASPPDDTINVKEHTNSSQTEMEIATSKVSEIPLQTIINWLDEILIETEQSELLRTFYIFISTHYAEFDTDGFIYQRLFELHNKLKTKPGYSKWIALEKLNQDGYSGGYRPFY